jgi:hypothetical protein
MICLIVLLDNPFRGEVGVSPQAFELIYGRMTASPSGVGVRFGSLADMLGCMKSVRFTPESRHSGRWLK